MWWGPGLGKEQLQQELQKPPWEKFDRDWRRPFGRHLLQLPPQTAGVAAVFASVPIDPWPITAVCSPQVIYPLVRMLKENTQVSSDASSAKKLMKDGPHEVRKEKYNRIAINLPQTPFCYNCS